MIISKGIKAVDLGYHPKNNNNFKFEVGKQYGSENGYCFCDTAYATLEYYENPLTTKYLEVESLVEAGDMGDGHSFISNKIKIIREIELEELRQDSNFNARCVVAEEIRDEAWKKIDEEMKSLHEDLEKEDKIRRRKLMLAGKVACIPLIVFIILWIILPLALHYLGIV